MNPEVIVIGGGPAGSTAASVLAMHGRRVLLLEKDKFPRYHIGESLMPYCYFPLERIGMIEAMKASHFPKKYSVQFISVDGRASQPFYFYQHFDHPASTTWQVLRSEFDLMLLNNARAKGVEVREQTKVTEILREGGAVVGVKTADGEVRAPVTIDASGREMMAPSRRRWVMPDPALKRVALWTYYRGAKRDPGLDEGATTVAFLPEKGWFWYIPLPDDVVSVGVVATGEYLFGQTRDQREVFDREVTKNRWIQDHLAPGTRVNAPGLAEGPFYLTSEWSYRSRHCGENGLVVIGDALAFLDPVFSSGVFLALKGGVLAGDAVQAALKADDVSAARFTELGATLSKAVEDMRQLVYAFYDRAFSMKEFVTANPTLRGDVTDCLIGNLLRDFSGLFAAVGRFATLPPPMPVSTPFGGTAP